MGAKMGERSRKPFAPGNPAWVLARTCNTCGLFRQADRFRTKLSGKGQRFLCSACRDCENVRTAEGNKKNGYQTSKRNVIVKQRQTMNQAYRSHTLQEWTGPELEMLLREELTANQIARMIGRTHYAVRQARTKLRSGKWTKANNMLRPDPE